MFDYISQDVGEGWWEARNQNGLTGYIPKDYVELITASSLPEPSMPPPPLPTIQTNHSQSAWSQPAPVLAAVSLPLLYQ